MMQKAVDFITSQWWWDTTITIFSKLWWIILILLAMIIISCLLRPSSSAKKKRATIQEKNSAMRKKPTKRMLSSLNKIHDGDLVLGSYGSKIVKWGADLPNNHLLCCASSGAGKTSTIILDTLLTCKSIPKIVIDIKNELWSKTNASSDKNCLRFCPGDNSSVGFDPYYSLTSNSSDSDLLKVMQIVAHSIIKVEKGESEYFSLASREMATGLFCYYYSIGITNIIDQIDQILSVPINKQLHDVMTNESASPNSKKLLSNYVKLAEQTLTCVVSNLHVRLTSFLDSDLRYAFKEAKEFASPLCIEEHKSLFLCVREDSLVAQSSALCMIINLTLAELIKRPEKAHRCIVCIDELGVLTANASMDYLGIYLMSLRSRNVRVLLSYQATSSLQLSKPMISSIVNNCQIRLILDSGAGVEMIENIAPTYVATQLSSSTGSNGSENHSESYQMRKAVEGTDMVNLQRDNELICICPDGFYIIKKVPYYCKLFKKIIKNNKL